MTRPLARPRRYCAVFALLVLCVALLSAQSAVTVILRLTTTRIDTTTTRLINVDFSGTYTALEVWQNTFGVSFTRDAVKRTCFFFNSSVPLGQIGTLTAAFEKTAFDDPAIPDNNYNEVVFRFMLSRSW